MQTTVKNIRIIHAESESGIAESIAADLRERLAGNSAPQETAIILVSDTATEDDAWQKDVRALSENVRLIPAGQTINADYSNPDVIPPRVEELNFIRIDDALYDNLWESVNIDTDFYNVRNNVLVNMDAWLTSEKSDAFLISGFRESRKNLRVVQKKLQSETDEASRTQLEDMETYLTASKKRARRTLLKTIRHRSFVVLSIAFLIWLAFAANNILGYMQRATDEMALVGVEHTESNAFQNVVRLLDGVNNPLIDSTNRTMLYQEALSYLDINWCSTPVGLNYKHELTDAQLVADRYIQTSTDHGHQLIWDTWRGTIAADNTLAETGLRALYVDVENPLTVFVTSDNKVVIGIDNQWFTNDYEHPFADDSRIQIESNEDWVLIYDTKNVFSYERTENSIRPATYITAETMPFDDYTIHSAVINSTGHSVVFEANGELHVREYGPGHESGYVMGIEPMEDCPSAVRVGLAVFADKDGNILLFDADNPLETIVTGLRLPDPKCLCFVNDTTIAYYDAQFGTRLYDFRQRIDLGSAFTGIDGIDMLESTGTALMCHANGLYICQPIESMLPLKDVDTSEAVAVHDQTSDESDSQIHRIEITDDGIILMSFSTTDKEYEVAIDGGHYLDVGSALTDAFDTSDGTKRFGAEPLVHSGHATVVGLVDNGYGFVIGADDGSFQEIVLYTNGGYTKLGSFRAPSHAAIVAIYEMEDCYYLLDAAGNYWYARLSWPSMESGNSLALQQLNAKLRTCNYVTQELYDSVSEFTREDLSLKVMPGGDGKEWE